MKKLIYFLSPFLFFGNIQAQVLFEKLEDNALVLSPSDARSVNFVDVNNDGLDDVFVTSGPQSGATHLLYINQGNGEFEEIGPDPISTTPGPFDGASFADADNDGNLDVMAVTWYGVKNFLYFGNGDGTFTEAEDAVPTQDLTFSETTAWGDYDGDGLVDIYVTNSNGNDPNFLYKNLGNGEFEKITSGPPATDARVSRSVNWVDYDNDCLPDLFVSNENNQPDDLYRNLGDGTFENVGQGAPSQGNRSTISSSWGDVDNDGDLDVAVVNNLFSAPQGNQLFLNDGNGTFSAILTGDFVTDGGCSNGTSFGDYDNDGDLDLVVANGYCSGPLQNFLYKNDGNGNFSRDLESIADLGTNCSYGTAWGDIDNDGFLDLGFATCRRTGEPLAENIFFRNLGNGNNYLKIKPIGTMANRSAIGAKVWVTATIGGEEVTQMREITSQSGYCGQNSLLAHFGLGDAAVASEVRIQFGCESDTTLTDVPANQTLEVTEDMPTSTDEILRGDRQKLKVFPNPSDGAFGVEFFLGKDLPEMDMRLFTPTGKLVGRVAVPSAGGGYFSTRFFPKKMGLVSGVYFLKMGGEVVRVVVR